MENITTQEGNTTDTILQKRSYIPVLFSLVILFFFFTFCDFKCNSQRIASVKGIDLVTGKEINQEFIESDLPMFKNSSMNIEAGNKIDPNIWAIIAFISAILGLLTLALKGKIQLYSVIILGIVGGLSLLLLQNKIQSTLDQKSEFSIISATFQFGYWAALVVFVVISIVAYLELRKDIKA
jgi:hypothetical protein